MYVPAHVYAAVFSRYDGKVATEVMLISEGSNSWNDWVDGAAPESRTAIVEILSWLVRSFHAIMCALSRFFHDPGPWLLHALSLSYGFLRHHPYLICLTSLCLFLGPIVLLLPVLLIHEVFILLLLNLSFVTHGLVLGRLVDQYGLLKEHFTESREQVFAFVDTTSATFNKWTTDHLLLRLLRVGAGIIGFWMAYQLWGGYLHTPAA